MPTPQLPLADANPAGSDGPLAGLRVEVWQCDAQGVYSGFAGQTNGSSAELEHKTFLRGGLLAGQDGEVRFHTIYPGWYEGRTTHIHVKVLNGARAVLGAFFAADFPSFVTPHPVNVAAMLTVNVAMMLATILLTRAVERSRFGMALLAIKQNEAAAEAAGINTLAWKLRAITLSGAIAGAVGGFYAVVLLVVTPQSVFGMLVSAQALTVAMFGGVGTVWGPVIGSVILIPLAETLNAEAGSRFPGIQGVIYGLAIICVILLAPEGLFWKVRDFLRKRSAPPAAAKQSAQDAPVAASIIAAPLCFIQSFLICSTSPRVKVGAPVSPEAGGRF